MTARRELLPVPVTDREWEVLKYRVCDGLSCKETAIRMAISPHTVDVYMAHARARLQILDRGVLRLVSFLVDAGVLQRDT